MTAEMTLAREGDAEIGKEILRREICKILGLNKSPKNKTFFTLN